MEIEEFVKLAKEKFGDKVRYSGINISQEDLEKFNQQYASKITINDFNNYKQLWIVDKKCPICGEELLGLFGFFEWGIVHGEGFCGNCKRASFRYYHYLEGCSSPFSAISLIGYSE